MPEKVTDAQVIAAARRQNFIVDDEIIGGMITAYGTDGTVFLLLDPREMPGWDGDLTKPFEFFGGF